MEKRKALIVRGGWEGHEPIQVSLRYKQMLEEENFDVEISDTLDAYLDYDHINNLDLIVPLWTGGELNNEQTKGVSEAVGRFGVGLAGNHGGMCDSFRTNVEWQFMTGAQWVSHPGGYVDYDVYIAKTSSPITEGLNDFHVPNTEQYYIHIDPACEILATTQYPYSANYYHAANGHVHVPVIMTKRWGHGRVFYNTLGHTNPVFDIYEAREMMRRGFLWAAEGKRIFRETNADPDKYVSNKKMY